MLPNPVEVTSNPVVTLACSHPLPNLFCRRCHLPVCCRGNDAAVMLEELKLAL